MTVSVPVLGDLTTRKKHPRVAIGWDDLCSESAPAPARSGAGRSPAVDPLLVGYHRTAQAARPRPRRHRRRACEDARAASGLGPGDRFFWFTTTGWMMWNYLIGGLLVGATVVCFDGSPFHPDPLRLWKLAADEGVTCFGVGAPFIESCRKLGLHPEVAFDLSTLRTIGSTGSALVARGLRVGQRGLRGVEHSSGRYPEAQTCARRSSPRARLCPVRAGELQCRALGAAVAAFSPEGRPLVDEVGELVITQPMPSMPLKLWGDDDGSRLHSSYFAEFPGVWRHGDWVKITSAIKRCRLRPL